MEESRVWLAIGVVWLVWGATYLAIRFMVLTGAPLVSNGARYAAAGLVLFGFLLARRKLVIGRPRRRACYVALAGGLGLAVPNGLVAAAETDMPSSLAALLMASVPLWLVAIRWFVGRERVWLATAASGLIGFAGIAILLLPSSRPAGASWAAILLIGGAALSSATFAFWAPRLLDPTDVLGSTAWQMVCGGILMAAAGTATGESSHLVLASQPPRAWFAFAYLVLVSGTLGYTCYLWLLTRVPVSLVGTYAYVNPVIAVILGWAVAGESITTGVLVGSGMIVASVAATVSQEGRSRAVPARRGT